ncbi:hypothetical protein ABZ569_10700 [Streptomyces albus]|uniref:hypothetical protein n=1 Tax=Streptomyces albus TaxID=1888 RepID=UPI0033D4D9CD
MGYHVTCDDAFETSLTAYHYLSLGDHVAHLADRLHEATSTCEAADVLTELTAPHDGILAAVYQVIEAAAAFHDELGDTADPHRAERLRYLSRNYLHAVTTDLRQTRNDLADRHAPHPRRTVCTGEVPDTEREASAVCACPSPASAPAAAPPVPGPGRSR